MKQKEGAPFHRCLVDRSLHYPPNTKASKTYSQQSFEFHIRDGGTLDGACMFGRLSCAPRLHFSQQSISLWLQSICSSSLRGALPGLWVLGASSRIPPAFPEPWWRCSRADGTDLSPAGHGTPLVFHHAFLMAVWPGRDFGLCCVGIIQHCDGKCRVNYDFFCEKPNHWKAVLF